MRRLMSFSLFDPDNKESDAFKYWHSYGLWIFVVVIMVLFSLWFAYRADQDMRKTLLIEATIAARSINIGALQKLDGAETDLTSPEYKRFKEQLASMRTASPQYRFLYLMGKNDMRRLFFYVDSEAPDSDDYSPPGQIYYQPSPELVAVFDDKKSFVEGPISDDWGVWVSAIVPILDAKTNKVIAIFGMDVAANTWYRAILFALWKPISFVFLLLICLVTVSDITARKREEKRLRNVNAKLINETMRANTMAREARESSAAKSIFAANMGHQIKTPLSEMIAHINLLADTRLSEEQSRYMKQILEEGDYLINLLVEALDLSRIEAGLLVIEHKNFFIRDVLTGLKSDMSRKARAKGLSFEVVTDDDVPLTFMGDAGRLRQILDNLVENAVIFTEEGNVTVRVSLISKTKMATTLRFSVNDTGIGIPTDKLKDIFDKFVQLHPMQNHKHRGTGLGLTIAQKLVEKMGGGISVISQEGQGSEFWFTLMLDNGTM